MSEQFTATPKRTKPRNGKFKLSTKRKTTQKLMYEDFLLTCPHCGNNEFEVIKRENGECRIICPHCGLVAPFYPTLKDACHAYVTGIVDGYDLKKPCPFCGGRMHVYYNLDSTGGYCYIGCSSCDTFFYGNDIDDGIGSYSVDELVNLWDNWRKEDNND